MSAMRWIVGGLGLTTLLATFMASSAKLPKLPDDPRDVPRESQLTTTEIRADLDGDGNPETLVAVNALTGESDPAHGSEVLFGVAAAASGGQRGPLYWSRRISAESGQPAHDGELSAVDLDGDGRSELILTWDRALTDLRRERVAEVYVFGRDLGHPRKAWEGWWEKDTRRDPKVPEAQREWVRREIDFGATRRAAGRGISLKSTRTIEAGRKLDPPRVEQEWIDVSLR